MSSRNLCPNVIDSLFRGTLPLTHTPVSDIFRDFPLVAASWGQALSIRQSQHLRPSSPVSRTHTSFPEHQPRWSGVPGTLIVGNRDQQSTAPAPQVPMDEQEANELGSEEQRLPRACARLPVPG